MRVTKGMAGNGTVLDRTNDMMPALFTIRLVSSCFSFCLKLRSRIKVFPVNGPNILSVLFLQDSREFSPRTAFPDSI